VNQKKGVTRCRTTPPSDFPNSENTADDAVYRLDVQHVERSFVQDQRPDTKINAKHTLMTLEGVAVVTEVKFDCLTDSDNKVTEVADNDFVVRDRRAVKNWDIAKRGRRSRPTPCAVRLHQQRAVVAFT